MTRPANPSELSMTAIHEQALEAKQQQEHCEQLAKAHAETSAKSHVANPPELETAELKLPERIELPNGCYWETYGLTGKTIGAIRDPYGAYLHGNVAHKAAVAFATAMNRPEPAAPTRSPEVEEAIAVLREFSLPDSGTCRETALLVYIASLEASVAAPTAQGSEGLNVNLIAAVAALEGYCTDANAGASQDWFDRLRDHYLPRLRAALTTQQAAPGEATIKEAWNKPDVRERLAAVAKSKSGFVTNTLADPGEVG